MYRSITVHFVVFLLCLHHTTQFNIMAATVSAVPTVISNPSAVYTIYVNRGYSPEGSQTTWSADMAPTAAIVITFPSQFPAFTADYACSTIIGTGLSNFRTCNSPCTHDAGTTKLTIGGCFSGNVSGAETLQISINGIRNPSVALTTGYFIVTVGDDATVVGTTASVSYTPGASSCSVTFTPAYFNKTSSMVVRVTPQNSIPITGTVVITLPNQNYWTGDLASQPFGITSEQGCTTTAGGAIVCEGSSALRRITAKTLFTGDTSTQFTVTINNILAPPSTANTDQIGITTTDGQYSIDSCSTSVTGLVPNPLTVAIAPSVTTIGLTTPLLFTLTVADTVTNANTFEVIFPTGSVLTANSISSSLYAAGSTVSYVAPKLSFTLTAVFTRESGSTLSFTFNTYTMPPSAAPVSFTVNILKAGVILQTGSTTITPTVTTLTASVTNSPTTVNMASQYTFVITLPNVLSSTGVIDITFPNAITFGTPEIVSISGTNVAGPGTVAITSASVLRISGFGTGVIGGGAGNAVTIVIGGVNNPSSTAPTTSFSFIAYYSNPTLARVSTGTFPSITATVATLNVNAVTVTASDRTVKASPVIYNVNFVNIGAIPNGGSITLRIPSDIAAAVDLASLPCSLTVGGAPFFLLSFTASLVSSQIQVRFNLNSVLPANSAISLQVSSLTNPSSTRTASAFSIATFALGGVYKIDELTSAAGVGIKMLYSAAFVSIDITPTSRINSALTSYKVTITQPSAIEAAGLLVIVFPSTVIPDPTVTCSPSCTLSSSNTLRVTLPSTPERTPLEITINNVKNPPSFAVSAPFIFNSYVAADMLNAYCNDSSHTVQTNQQSTISSVIFNYSPRFYGSTSTSLAFTFTPTYNGIGSMRIILNGDLTSASLGCTAPSGISGINCASVSNIITVTGTFTGSTIGMTISYFNTPKIPTAGTTVIQTFDSGSNPIDTFSGMLFTTDCQMPCKQCSGPTTNCTSCYTDADITPNKFYNPTPHTCTSTCDDGFFENTVSVPTCSPCAASCRTCSGVLNNCTSCLSTSPTPYHDTSSTLQTCNSTCTGGYYADVTSSSCLPCSQQCKTCTTLPQRCTSCNTGKYYYPATNECVSLCPPDVSVVVGVVCTPCASVCATCAVDITNCLTCAPGTAKSGTTCLANCPNDDEIILNSECVKCFDPCSKCSIARGNCTSCKPTSTTPLYFNNECLDHCPPAYFNVSATGNCLSCAAYSATLHCTDCYSEAGTMLCKNSCTGTYVYSVENKTCLAEAPMGYVAISGVIQPCAAQCQSCGPTQGQCLTCTGSNYLYNKNCIAATACPGGTIPLSNKCEPCDPSCATCSSSTTNCNSCNSPNYLNGNVCGTECPLTTFKNDTSRKCENCQSNCDTCDTASFCRTCNVNFYLYENTCKSNCPKGLTGLANACQPCQTGCSDCTLSTSYCISCTSTYYFLPASFACVQTCPPDLYPYYTNMTCIGCISPCKQCSGIPTNCTSCVSGGLLGNQCYQNCPSSHYLLDQKCVNCTVGCATCTSATVCTSCMMGYYSYLSSCLGECPSNRPVITLNGTCVGCSTTFCSTCMPDDSCYLCQGTKLVYSNTCVDLCPTNFESNGTFCILTESAKSLADSLKQNGVVPLPFTIGTALIILICLFSKFTCPSTFFTGALYSIVGILEPIVHTYLIYLLWSARGPTDLIVRITIGSLASLYLINMISMIAVNVVFCKDLRFKEWFSTASGKISYILFSTLSLVLSFKVMNIIFCKLFNLHIFKCKLQHHTRLFCLQLMTFLALVHSLSAMVISAYNLYYMRNIATMLFFQSIDLIIIAAIEMFIGFFNAKKDDSFFDEYDDPMLGKRVDVDVDNDSMNTLIQPFGNKKYQNENRKGGKYRIETKDRVQGEQLISEQFQEDEEEDAMGMMPSKYKHTKRVIKRKESDKYEELSERSNAQSLGDPSSRLINDERERSQRFKNITKEPRVNYQEISVDFRGSSDRENNLNELGTDGNEEGEGIETIDINNVKKDLDPKDSIDISKQKDDDPSKVNNQDLIDQSKRQISMDKTPTKLRKSRSNNLQNLNNHSISKLSEGESNNRLLQSVEQSDEFGNKIEDYPLNASTQKLKIGEKSQNRGSPLPRKMTVQQDVQEFQWQQQNNPNNTISPKKKTSKLEFGGEDIRDISGISEEGRENMMRLKYEMENRKIDENSKEDDPEMRGEGNFSKKKGDSQLEVPVNFEEKSKNLLLEQSKEQLEPSENNDGSNDLELELIRTGPEPFMKTKFNGTFFSGEKVQDRSRQQQGSTITKNSQTMDKSRDESEDDINDYPAYMRYKKTIEDNVRPYNSIEFNKEKQAYGQSFNNPLGTQQNFTDQQYLENSQDEDFPDELSREVYRYQKKGLARVESGKEFEKEEGSGFKGKDRFAMSAGNRNIPFLRPIEGRGKRMNTSETEMILEEGPYPAGHSLEKIPQGLRNEPSGIMSKRGKHSSMGKMKAKDKKIRNNELERIYLGSVDYEK